MSAEPQTSITRGTRYWALLLLLLAAVPDVLPYPGLKSIVAERFGLADAGAQLFAIFALLGALGAVPMLRRARQWAPRKVFALAALVQALSIGLMVLPIDWLLVLLLRCIQGYVDLLLLVTLTTIVAASARSTGRGFGIAGSAVMIGLAIGLALGGWIATFSVAAVFPISAAISLLLAVAAWGLPNRPLALAPRQRNEKGFDRRVITGGAFSASDRMISGMMTVSLPLLLANNFGSTPSTIGLVLAMPLLICAIGGYASGMIVDRLGAVPVRLIGVPLQAGGLAMIVLSGGGVLPLMLGTLVLAFGALLLMPTSLVIGAGKEPGAVSLDAVGGIQAIGQAGHLFGVLSITLLSLVVGSVSTLSVLGLLGFYLLWNAGWLGHLMSRFGGDASGSARRRSDLLAVAPRRTTVPRTMPRPHRRKPAGVPSSPPMDS